MRKMLFFIVLLIVLVGCAENNYYQESQEETHLQIVTTIFPQYDFIRQIAGNTVELSMLISPGAESHSYEPTPRDIITLYQANLFVYVCSEAEHWVNPVLNSLDRDNMLTVSLIDLVAPIYAVHNHEYEHHHEHSHHHDYDYYDYYDCEHEHEHHHHHHLYDEHIWTCPRNAILIVNHLTEVLAELSPKNADYFHTNAAAYILELEALDAALAQVVADGVRTTLIFGDRFPFVYLTETHGLCAYAAFDGCSNETYVSPARVAYLIEKVESENISIIFYIEFSDRRIANVIAEATGVELFELHSAHNVTQAEFDAGITYLEIMQRNIEHLRRALS